jgi:prepilin-type N-terminal cleavage/methylation domain-containing protein/prepilin-type processing-associated H-X9-DG protein
MRSSVRAGTKRISRRAFTLIELLVVISIIGVLVGFLLPAMSRARGQAQSVRCKSNLQQVGVGLLVYSSENRDFVVPSYNLPMAPGATTNFTGGPEQALDGWVSILDRDKYVSSSERDANSIFYCPKTVDVDGMELGQTGSSRDNPRGWTDWPLRFLSVGGDSSPKQAVTIPERRFNKIIRVSYWLNAYNPIGNRPSDIEAADQFYTASVGFGPDAKGKWIRLHKAPNYRPGQMIVVADGLYMGRHAVTRMGDTNSRIGYRHPGSKTLEGAANIAMADGHVEGIDSDRFPRALSGNESAELLQEKRTENLRGPTIYADPRRIFR